MPTISTLDDNSRTLGLPPQDVVTIAADAAITWAAVTPATTGTIYFEGTDETTYSLDAGITILVHPSLRFSANTVCMVY